MQTREGVEIAGRYRLETVVGRGGMAAVWRACDTRLDRPVAVKVLSDAFAAEPDFVQRFEREALIAARLAHPNLVPVHDLGFDEDRPFLVMEYVAGDTLASRLDRDPGSVDPEAVARGLLEALIEIHSMGVVHRDVKPANVLIGRDERPRLTDFGIARILDETSITRTGQVIGTLRYMAPEVRNGEVPTPRSDLYSLGVLLADCGPLNGRIGALVARMRSADPVRRPAGSAEALAALTGEQPSGRRAPAALLGPEPPAPDSPPATDPEPTARTLRARPLLTFRRRSLLAGLGAGAAAIAIALTLVLSGGPGQPDSEQGAATAGGEGPAREDGGAGGASQPAEETGGRESLAAAAGLPDVASDPARGARLNDEGFRLLEGGRPEQALPVLRRAVASFPEGSADLQYAYALFNLARALRLSGSPEAAIPVLRERLRFDDQRATVRAELRRARIEARSS